MICALFHNKGPSIIHPETSTHLFSYFRTCPKVLLSIPLLYIKSNFWIVPLSQSWRLSLLIFHNEEEDFDDFETIFVKTGLSFVAAQLVGKSFTVKQSVFCHQFCHSKISRARPHKGHANKAYLFLKYIFLTFKAIENIVEI